MVEIRHARPGDADFWFSLDRHLAQEGFARLIRDGLAYVLLEDGVPAGILRYGFFWDNTPFCNLLAVRPSRRRKGHGRLLMARWEEDMRSRGFALAMTSTRADEDAQHFYRKLGYRDAGCLLFPGQPAELFLIHEIQR